eukprot:4723251-Prymnesium_polylepis.1
MAEPLADLAARGGDVQELLALSAEQLTERLRALGFSTMGGRMKVDVALKAATGSDSARALSSASALKVRGNDMFKKANNAAALEAYTAALDEVRGLATIDQQWAEAPLRALRVSLLSNAAAVHIKSERWVEAVKSATEGLQLEPSHPKMLYRRGVAWSRQASADSDGGKLLDLAKADFEMACRLEPQNKDTRHELQKVLSLQGATDLGAHGLKAVFDGG